MVDTVGMRGSSGGKRYLATVLFTDIVGSTDVAVELGDRRWRELITRHHAVIRRELKRFGGREIDTAGDGFLMTFTAPGDGIRCACAASEAVQELGVDIRAGVHVGECEQMGKKVGGIAVHIGARVLSVAGPGEVLVTATARDLVGGSGIGFEDRGFRRLKGVPDEWRLFVVSEVDGRSRVPPLAKEAGERLREGVTPPPLMNRRRGPIGVAVAVAVVVAAGAAGGFLFSRGATTIRPGADTVAEIAAGGHAFTRAIEVGGGPSGVAAGAGSIWVINQADGTVQRISPDGPKVVTKSTLGPPTGIAVGGGYAWITTGFGTAGATGSAAGKLYKFDPRSDGVTPAADVSGGKSIAVGDGSVWVADDVNNRVLRIDPKTGRSDNVRVGEQPVAIAIGPGGSGPVWVANAVAASVSRIDPRTDRSESFDVNAPPSGIAVDAHGGVWVTSSVANTVIRLDATGHTVQTIPVPRGPTVIAVTGDGVWVAASIARVVTRIDPTTNQVTDTLPVVGVPTGIAVDADGDVWVTVAAA